MTMVLVGSPTGCRTINEKGESRVELTGRAVTGLTGTGAGCLAIVDGREIWQRDAAAQWSHLTTTTHNLVAIAPLNGGIVAATDEPAMISMSASGETKRLTGFDTIEGRDQWFGQGPPLHIRALTVTADGAIMAAVHVGGIPRSSDGGKTWAPTIPVMDDVHEVKAHPTRGHLAAAATAYGLSVSQDGGSHWTTLAQGLEVTHGLAVTFLDDEALFSVQEHPFAPQSQIWRWKVGGTTIEQVREGLPQWLEGKVDTLHIACGAGRAAVVDGKGHLWLSTKASSGWRCVADDMAGAYGGLAVQ